MASKPKQSRKKQASQKKGYNSFDPHNPPGQPEQEETGAASSPGMSGQKLPSTWGTFDKSDDATSTAQTEQHQHRDLVQSQKDANSKVSQTERCKSGNADPSGKPTHKQKNEKSSRSSSFSKKIGKGAKRIFGRSSNNAVRPTDDGDMESTDISKIEEDEMEQQEEDLSTQRQSEQDEEEIWSPVKDSIEETVSQLQARNSRLQHELDESKSELASKETKLNEVEVSLEDSKRRRVEWQDLVDLHQAESEKLKKENDELNRKITEEALKCDTIKRQLEDKTAEVNKLIEENQDLNQNVGNSKEKEKELHEKDSAITAAKKSYEDECHKNSELSHKLDAAEARIEALVSKVSELDIELKNSKAALQEKSDKIIVLLEQNNSCTSETSKKAQAFQEQLSQRDSELTKYKEKVQHLETRNREVAQQCRSLQTGSHEANAKLKQFQEKMDREKQKSKESESKLERVREEHHHKIVQMKQKLEESTKSSVAAHNKAEELVAEKEGLLQRLEVERKQWFVKLSEETRVLKNYIAELEHKLDAKNITHENRKVRTVHLLPFPSPGKGEMKHEINLDPKNLAGEKSQSMMQLQSESLEQPPCDVSLHSSAPSSLRKDSHSSVIVSEGSQQDETPSENQSYESPLTSLNQVAGKVTVNEENMTDAVKASIQHEVVVLPNKVQSLQQDNDRLKLDLKCMNDEQQKLQLEWEAEKSEMLSELKLMETERRQWQADLKKLQDDKVNLEKIKVQYFNLVEERTNLLAIVQDPTTSDIPAVSVTEGIVSCLNDKDKRILELEEQLKQLRTENDDIEKKLQQLQQRQAATETYEGVDVESSLDFRQMHSTLTTEITSVRRQLSRAESEQSSSVKELYSLKEEKKQLEEEHSRLKMLYDQLQRKSQYWQQQCEQCEKRGDVIQTFSKEAESKASQLQDELNLCQDQNARYLKEIEHWRSSVFTLNDRLEKSKQDIDRQRDQIMKLVAVKSGLDKELENLGKVQVESQHFKEDFEIKLREVVALKQEKVVLREQITALKGDMEIKNIEILTAKEDFQAERNDRQKLASQLDLLKARLKVSNQKLDHAEQQTQYYSTELENSQDLLARQTESHEQKLENLQNTLTKQRQSFENQIQLLSDQIEEMQTDHEEKLKETTEKLLTECEEQLQVTTDQMKKEADIQLRKHKAEALKETNRLTELLQSSKDDFHSQLAGAETEYRELQRIHGELEAENSRNKRDFIKLEEEYHKMRRVCDELEQENLKIQTDMTLTTSSLESQIEEIKVKCQELLKHNESHQATIAILQSKNQTLASGNRELEHQLRDITDQHAREKQKFNKQLQNIDVVRKVLKTQLDTEVQRTEEATKIAEESRSEVTALSRELDTKDQIIGQLQRELKFIQDKLNEMEFKNAQIESEMKKMTIQNVGLERERNILHSRRMEGDGQGEVNRQLIAERDELEAKYSKLLDDYRMMQQIAIRHGLRVPQRDEASPYANPPLLSDSNVRPFSQDAYLMHPPMQDHSRRSYTSHVSGLGPVYHGPQQLLASNQGSRSPGSRNRQDCNDPANVISENELAQGIDHDIAEAAAHMEEKEIHTTMVSMSDARPLDSNLICPLCGKQFRIGQIQHYRQHVDNCSKNPV